MSREKAIELGKWKCPFCKSEGNLLESKPKPTPYERIFHRCGDKIRPYPGVLCSLHRGQHNPSDDFDPIAEIDQLTEELKAKNDALRTLKRLIKNVEVYSCGRGLRVCEKGLKGEK